MNKALVVGKGPSVQEIPDWEDHTIVVLNEATIYCTRVDFLFVADIETLDNISLDELVKVDTLVVPAHPWVNHQQYPDLTHLDLLERAPGVGKFIVYEGRLENPDIQPLSWLPRIDGTVSTGDTAIAWLLSQGYKEFVLSGLEPSGGYAKRSQDLAERLTINQALSIECPKCNFNINADIAVKHACATPQAPDWFRWQYEKIIERIESHDASYQRLENILAREPAST